MGQPSAIHLAESVAEYIGGGGNTRRSETSQYPQGKEINRDCPSSGERTGKSPNSGGVIADTRCRREVVGSSQSAVSGARFTHADRRRVWNGPPQKVTVL